MKYDDLAFLTLTTILILESKNIVCKKKNPKICIRFVGNHNLYISTFLCLSLSSINIQYIFSFSFASLMQPLMNV